MGSGLKNACHRALSGAIRLSLPLVGRRVWQRLAGVIAGTLSPEGEALAGSVEAVDSPRGRIAFYCIGDLPLWRARTLLTKEPETIEWLERIAPGEVLWDIGANVGLYSLYAATGRALTVLAFEPNAANYYLLSRNIGLNGLADRVSAYCLAFSDATTLGTLMMQEARFGAALSSFGVPVGSDGSSFEPKLFQGMVGFAIDDFVARFDPPFPNHIKIDVDGIEDRIIAGAARTLADPRLRSLSVELDAARTEETGRVVAAIEAGGLRLTGKRHGEMFESGPHRTIYNYHFERAA